MSTGISGSNTIERASMMRGLSAAVRAGSLVRPAVCIAVAGAQASADAFWMTGSGFIIVLLGGHDLVASLGGGAERIPRQRRALDAHRKLAAAPQPQPA